jgi:hypothetical protein
VQQNDVLDAEVPFPMDEETMVGHKSARHREKDGEHDGGELN